MLTPLILTSRLMLAAVLAPGGLSVEVAPLAGPVVKGQLQSIDKQQLVLQTSDGVQTLPLTKLRRAKVADAQPSEPKDPLITVELADGSRVMCRQFAVQDGQARLEPFRGPAFVTPVGALKWVLLRPLGDDAQLRRQWDELLQREAAGDRIAFARERDDEVSLEHLDGALFNVGEATVEFQMEGDRVSPKRTKLTGLIYLQRGDRKLPDTVCTVALTDGSTLEAVDLALQGEQLNVVTAADVKVAVPWEAVSAFDFATSNVVYLSDLDPVTVECEPYFGVTLDSELEKYLPREDVDFRGQPLRVHGRPPAAKGLAVRSKTLIVYRLKRPYKRFKAVAGIAEHLRGSEITPHLKLVISSSNKKLLEKVITGNDEPLELDIDVTGVQRLSILVDYGDGQDIADHLHFCDARLLK